MDCTWEKEDGRYVCQAKQCIHWTEDGCGIGKVSLSCDNNDCKWNQQVKCTGLYNCKCMDVHLDANGKCLGFEKPKERK